MMPGEGRFSDGRAGPFFGTPWAYAGTQSGFSGRARWNSGLGIVPGYCPNYGRTPLAGATQNRSSPERRILSAGEIGLTESINGPSCTIASSCK
jgi:hypothetical protein